LFHPVSDPVIAVENLSKTYLVGHKSAGEGRRGETFREAVGREARNIVRNAVSVVRGRQVVLGDQVEEFWALQDVSFEVKRGEVLGIIGRNGAGKSTLLKILSRITEPTRGRVVLRGRVASLLEVGTGFHGELTGRENIYLNGAILGMTRAEIRRKFDEIVAFAEVEKFLDTPVKRYSSGMYVRLAFAVAAHLDPEILIVDEVLAVGDIEFQKKCLGKMDEVSRGQGRTVLVVSHNLGIIGKLCSRAIWLDQGSICESGASHAVIREYLSRGALIADRVVKLDQLPRPFLEGSELRLKSIEWLSELPLRHGEEVKARIAFETRAPLANVAVGIGFSDLTGNRILSYDSDLQDGSRQKLTQPAVYSVDLKIDELPLQPDTYGLDIGCRSGDSYALDYIPAALQMEVLAGPTTPSFISYRSSGVRLNSRWAWDFGNSLATSANSGEMSSTVMNISRDT
jgi:lipopolysaccharide transport system ATP-binding protein